MIKVAKFGGTSMATEKEFERCAKIILNDKDCRVIVVSAGGKTPRYPKVTDMLIDAYGQINSGKDIADSLRNFFERIQELGRSIRTKIDLYEEQMIIEREMLNAPSLDFLLSCGEYLYSKMFASYLGIRFVDSKNLIKFDGDNLNLEYSCFLISEEYKMRGGFLCGGFYGSTIDGKIKVFSRGGGDLSGAILARGINATEYLNYTDVDGIYPFNPKEYGGAYPLKEISFDAVKMLGEFGASVLHKDSVLPLYGTGIPIIVKNTFNRFYEGTIVKEHCETPFAMAIKRNCYYVKAVKHNNGNTLSEVFKKYSMVINYNTDDEFYCITEREVIDEDVERLTVKSGIAVLYMSNNEKSALAFDKLKDEKYALLSVKRIEGYFVAFENKYENTVKKTVI